MARISGHEEKQNQNQNLKPPEQPLRPRSPALPKLYEPEIEKVPGKTATKKQRIVELHSQGLTDIARIAEIVMCRPSYVAAVLQKAGRLKGYYDLYTHTSEPMNVYSQYFKGKLGFRDLDVARHSVVVLERAYKLYQRRRDRAGQHHTLVTALTLFDRARWSRKSREAGVFRDWLNGKLFENHETH